MEGYPKLASWMSRYPEMAIFRSFRALNMQGLLYLQAELLYLEADQQRIALANKNDSDPQKAAYERNMWELSRSAEDGCDSQLQITKKTQEKLELYYRAILREHAIQSLDVPSDHEVKFRRDWQDHPKKGKSFLEDLEANILDEAYRSELISLRPKYRENDILSQWTKGKLLLWFHRLIGHKIKVWTGKEAVFSAIAVTYNIVQKLLTLCLDYQDPISFDPESGTANYDDKTIQRVIDVITIVIAYVFLVAPFFLHNVVSNSWAHLGIVTVSITLYVVLVYVAITATRVQIFATACAYAAVQVVFIGNVQGTVTH